MQTDGAYGQRHQQVHRRTWQLGGTSGEHAVAQVHQDALAGDAVTRTAEGGQTQNRLRHPQPQRHVRVVLSLLQADPRSARFVRGVLRPVHPGQDAHRTHLGSHPGILGAAGRTERAVHQVRGHEKGTPMTMKNR